MNLLIAGKISENNNLAEKLSSLGYNIISFPDERASVSSFSIDVADIDGVVCNGLFLYNDIKEFKNLKFIQLTSAGLDRVPTQYIREKGIKLFNAGGVYSVPIAETALLGVLGLYRHSYFFFENKKTRSFTKDRTLTELNGKKVLIVGCGSIGDACATRFSAFGCEVYGVDVVSLQKDKYIDIYNVNDLSAVLDKFDVVVLTLPLTEKTKGLFNKQLFGAMKKGSVFVNVSRGGIVNEDDLISALENRLSGAVLDVFCEEPLEATSKLWDMENVIITPHNAFVSDGNEERLQKLIIDNLSGEYRE